MKLVLFSLIPSLLTNLCIAQDHPTNKPFLMLNTEMHTAAINSIDTDAKGNYVLTCSSDKTAKLWHIGLGSINGLDLTYRIPIGFGDEGVLYACAISPDASTVVLGGWTGKEWEGSFSIYILDAWRGTLKHRINGLENSIIDIEFSPDGERLGVGLASGGIKIYNTGTWTLAGEDEKYFGPVSGLVFGFDGHLATVSYDGYLRLYDKHLRLVKKKLTELGEMPNSVSFHPNEFKVAVSYYDSGKVEVFKNKSLNSSYKPNIDKEKNSYCQFEEVCFSRTGDFLMASGMHKNLENGQWYELIRKWERNGRGKYQDFIEAKNDITDLKAYGYERVVYSGSQPDWGIIPEYSRKNGVYNFAQVFNFKLTDRNHLGIDHTGETIAFWPFGSRNLQFSILNRSIETKNADFEIATNFKNQIYIKDWDSFNTSLNGNPLDIFTPNERCESVDISSYETTLLGTTANLYNLNHKGDQLWKTAIQTPAHAINISGNDQTAVVAHGDGILRWYAMNNGTLLLSLYIHPETEQWVLWTPSGYYDCAAKSEDLIGWHVNQGANKEALFYPASRFRDTYYRPDIIDLILQTCNEEKAIRQANSMAARQKPESNISERLPPIVQITSHQNGQEVDGAWQNISYEIISPDGEPVTEVEVRVNNIPDTFEFKGSGSKEVRTREILIPHEDCIITVIAKNTYGSSMPATVKLKWTGVSYIEESKPNLYVLAIGVKEYLDHDYNNLKWSDKDANDLRELLIKQKGGLYKNVEIKLLQNENATSTNILEGMDWLASKSTSKDVSIIFLSGHGYSDNQIDFYFLPHNADTRKLSSTCISGDQLKKVTHRMGGKILIFTDACHSGSNGKAVNITKLINELTEAENGVIVFNSSTARQISQEADSLQNGIFTEALLEGLSGLADRFGNNNDEISVGELAIYIRSRIKRMKARQTPVTVPIEVPDYPLTLVLPF